MEQAADGGNQDEDHAARLFGGPRPARSPAEGPDQSALFRIEGPDEDGCVWICSPGGRDVWCQNLGPFEPTAEAMAAWLAQNDYGEA